jgi:hypothetical protein
MGTGEVEVRGKILRQWAPGHRPYRPGEWHAAAGGFAACLAGGLIRPRSLAAGRTARLLNVSDLAAAFRLSRPTISDCVTLLERVLLLEILRPWHSTPCWHAAFGSHEQ